jgi:formylglycine-generating enzyme required for sulfatase activity/predicted Ser/Thr protein kinase
MTLYQGMTLKDRYEVVRPLGEGGMGAAHLVDDQRLHRHCVIKEVLIPDTTSQGQFEREAQLLASLQHPNLPVVYDYFFDQGQPYIVMQYVEGMTLNRCGDERAAPFEIHDVLKWAQDLLDALRYIHEHDPPVIHRDVKPHNVCITPESKAVLLDFGIARHLDQSQTSTAARAFTTGYAPIEQYPEDELKHIPSVLRYVQALRAEGIRTGPYTDVYGLGATLYYALTLLPPPDACMRVLGEEPPPVRGANQDVPDFLTEAVMRALALHPGERFQSAAEMLGALQPQPAEAPAVHLRRRAPRSLPTGNVVALDQELIYVAAGEFLMGSDDPDLKEACRPQHRVALGPYCIGRRPVTNADYQLFVEANPDYPAPYSPMRFAQRYNWDRRTRTYPRGLENHPVVLVTWQDGPAYCRWLSEVTGYRCRLPTEAEWEKAASWAEEQGSGGAGEKRKYPWGDTFDEERCNVDAHGALRLKSSPVGRYSPAGDSPYGLVDMAGNVWEWTGSLYRPYPYNAGDGRKDLEAEGERVVRGGAYDEGPLLARCAWRNGVRPDLCAADIGFRVACVAK